MATAQWQRHVLERLGNVQSDSVDLVRMQELYIKACRTGKPVGEWRDEV